MNNFAVLLDTVSIQKYIFNSNKLKLNLGASHIVKIIYQDWLKESLKNVLSADCIDTVFSKWKSKNDNKIETGDTFGIGYIGGGNALLFFECEKTAGDFVYEWTKLLLIKAPCLKTASAIMEWNNDICFKELFCNIHTQLAENKNRYHPETVPAKFGITADCPFSGNSPDIWEKTENRYISAEPYAKLEMVDECNRTLSELCETELNKNYAFTNSLDKLGQAKDEKNYIAVVHIDGNSMGKKFQECESLSALRTLSININKAAESAFKKLTGDLCKLIGGNGGNKLGKHNSFHFSNENGKIILPIRPIIIGGDDITFVCDARLGIHLAEKYISFFENTQELSDITACAGVSIVKTKSPFYRAYFFAEELCHRAKAEARKKASTSWLDVQIFSATHSGPLKNIRQRHFNMPGLNLNFGPYLLSAGEDEEKSIKNLKKGMKSFHNTKIIARSVRKEFRKALADGPDVAEIFVKTKGIKDKLPNSAVGGYNSKGHKNSKTPYFDMIELMEFYPEELLDSAEGKQ